MPMTLKKLRRELAKAEAASERASQARAALPPGSTRARVTSANARWASAAEYRDLLRGQLAEAEQHPGHTCPECGSDCIKIRSRQLDNDGTVWWGECYHGHEGPDVRSADQALDDFRRTT